MLVLTRRTNDKVSFPQVGITLHFIRVQSGQVKVGVDAPRDIAIVRDEQDGEDKAKIVRRQLARLPREVRHGIRNELHEISVGLHLYRELLHAGLGGEAAETFKFLKEALDRLDNNEALKRPDDTAKPVDAPAVNGWRTEGNAIALIEHDHNERRLLSECLRLKGYCVNEFSDDTEVFDRLADHDAPRALLVNLSSSTAAAPQLIEKLRQCDAFRETTIFAVSDVSPQQHGLAMGRQGVDRWFPKPLELESLLLALEQAGVVESTVASESQLSDPKSS